MTNQAAAAELVSSWMESSERDRAAGAAEGRERPRELAARNGSTDKAQCRPCRRVAVDT